MPSARSVRPVRRATPAQPALRASRASRASAACRAKSGRPARRPARTRWCRWPDGADRLRVPPARRVSRARSALPVSPARPVRLVPRATAGQPALRVSTESLVLRVLMALQVPQALPVPQARRVTPELSARLVPRVSGRNWPCRSRRPRWSRRSAGRRRPRRHDDRAGLGRRCSGTEDDDRRLPSRQVRAERRLHGPGLGDRVLPLVRGGRSRAHRCSGRPGLDGHTVVRQLRQLGRVRLLRLGRLNR